LEVCQLPQTIAVKADCLEVVCSCCSECCIDGGGCSDVTSAPTPSPTSSPVMQLTASPTASPTTALPTANTLSSAPTTKAPTLEPSSGPTRPPIPATTPSPTPSPFIQTTAWPTTSPVTSLPTASPTPRPSGCTTAGISRDKDCYSTGDDIIASFTNCNPAPDDWIGVYPASADPNNLGDPNNSLWVWLCGSKSSCDSSVDAGTVTFENAGEVGKFKIYLVRRISGGPYSAYAESESFEVGNSCAAP
jgi:hypothetical protein